MNQEPVPAQRSPWQSGVASVQGVREKLSTVIRRYGLISFAFIQIIALTFLQKFAIQLDMVIFGTYVSIGAVQIILPIFYISFLIFAISNRPSIDLVRLGLFTIWMFTVFISVFIQRNLYSSSSVMLMVACYAPFIFKVDISAKTYSKILSIFINVMIIVSAIVLWEHAVQLIWNWKVWPNLNLLVSPEFLLGGFNYIQPITQTSKLMKPNGIFFLEVSTVSQFIAVAFAFELIYFKRLWRLAFFLFVLLSTFAGTGPLLLVLCAPVLIWKLSPRSIGAFVLVLAIGFVAADRIQWYQQVQGRFTEYEKQNSSASKRFVDPLISLVDAVQNKDAFFTGIGPGNTVKTDGTVSWAVTKVSVEYGLLPMLAFASFVGYVLFKNAPSQRVAFLLVVLFNFMGGGIIIPIYPLMLFLFGGLFRLEEPKPRRRSRRKSESSSPPDGTLGLGSKSLKDGSRLGQLT